MNRKQPQLSKDKLSNSLSITTPTIVQHIGLHTPPSYRLAKCGQLETKLIYTAQVGR